MRIQVLELPAIVQGEDVTTPFALIFDQCPPAEPEGSYPDDERMANLTTAVGGSGFLATAQTVEIVDRFQDVQVTTEFTEEAAR